MKELRESCSKLKRQEGERERRKPLDPAIPDPLQDFSVVRDSESFSGLNWMLSLTTTSLEQHAAPLPGGQSAHVLEGPMQARTCFCSGGHVGKRGKVTNVHCKESAKDTCDRYARPTLGHQV